MAIRRRPGSPPAPDYAEFDDLSTDDLAARAASDIAAGDAHSLDALLARDRARGIDVGLRSLVTPTGAEPASAALSRAETDLRSNATRLEADELAARHAAAAYVAGRPDLAMTPAQHALESSYTAVRRRGVTVATDLISGMGRAAPHPVTTGDVDRLIAAAPDAAVDDLNAKRLERSDEINREKAEAALAVGADALERGDPSWKSAMESALATHPSVAAATIGVLADHVTKNGFTPEMDSIAIQAIAAANRTTHTAAVDAACVEFAEAIALGRSPAASERYFERGLNSGVPTVADRAADGLIGLVGRYERGTNHDVNLNEMQKLADRANPSAPAARVAGEVMAAQQRIEFSDALTRTANWRNWSSDKQRAEESEILLAGIERAPSRALEVAQAMVEGTTGIARRAQILVQPAMDTVLDAARQLDPIAGAEMTLTVADRNPGGATVESLVPLVTSPVPGARDEAVRRLATRVHGFGAEAQQASAAIDVAIATADASGSAIEGDRYALRRLEKQRSGFTVDDVKRVLSTDDPTVRRDAYQWVDQAMKADIGLANGPGRAIRGALASGDLDDLAGKRVAAAIDKRTPGPHRPAPSRPAPEADRSSRTL